MPFEQLQSHVFYSDESASLMARYFGACQYSYRNGFQIKALSFYFEQNGLSCVSFKKSLFFFRPKYRILTPDEVQCEMFNLLQSTTSSISSCFFRVQIVAYCEKNKLVQIGYMYCGPSLQRTRILFLVELKTSVFSKYLLFCRFTHTQARRKAKDDFDILYSCRSEVNFLQMGFYL